MLLPPYMEETNNARTTSELRATSRPFYPKTTAFSISSGATHHLTGNKELFDPESLVDFHGTLKMPNVPAAAMEIVARGFIRRGGLALPDVRYVPGLEANVVSVAMLDAMDYDVVFSNGCLVKERLGDEVVGKATHQDGLYMVDFLQVPLHRGCLPSYDTVEAVLTFL